MQVRPVHVPGQCAPGLERLLDAPLRKPYRLAGLVVKRAEGRGAVGEGCRSVFQAEAGEDHADVGAHRDAGADFPQLLRLFVDGDPEAALLDRNGGGHAPQAGADDSDVRTLHDWPCP